jgi:hypothetical protein
MHAHTWGARADEAVQAGLQPQGTYWYLDTRRHELESVAWRGWQGRLRRAAPALDQRLKADPHQCCVHGDAKAANMLWEGGELAMCDFQYCGKSCAAKDLAYLLCCAASDGDRHEAAHLETYLAELLPLLPAERGAAAAAAAARAPPPPVPPPPSLRSFQAALDVAYCDLCRWMCGWGMWGCEFLVPRVQRILARIDGGSDLGSEAAYVAAVSRAYPTVHSAAS